MNSSTRIACAAIGGVLLTGHVQAQDRGVVNVLSRQIERELSSVGRYDSDISISSGVWLSRFIHLRLDGAVPSVVFLKFTPRLRSQVVESVESLPNEEPHGFVEFREYRFDVSACDGLSARIDALKAALVKAVGSVGERAVVREWEEVIVDGRVYELNLRIDRSLRGTFEVSENHASLFDPLDSLVRASEECAGDAGFQLRRQDF